MRKLLTMAFLALLMLTASSVLVLADDDENEEAESEGQNENEKTENQAPGFEAVLAFACSLVAARFLGKAS